ncbi:MAG: hypothetical protein KC620_25380, partial [Myxococcales bacterium]|nr:hypothetical protein [Myxococcales bacterium]
VWRVDADGKPRAVTSDGQSDRPFFLPDGRLLWVSSAGTGRAGFVLDGRRLTANGPVPAFPDRTRFVDGQVEFDAGEGVFRLDLKTGAMVPR